MAYSIWAAVGLYLVCRWIFLHFCKKRAVSEEQIDAELVTRLNVWTGPHE